VLAGCAEQTSQLDTGTVLSPGEELTIGSRFADFEFTDNQCKTRSFTSFRGQFTIIAFTSCDQEYSPAVTHLADLVAEKSNADVRVAGVDVFRTLQATDTAETCAALPEYGNENFLAVHDHNNTIRNRYGVKQDGRYFIIDHLGKIVDKGDIQNVDELRDTLDCMIKDYLDSRKIFEREM
jgi:peroxiredoxin